MCGWCRFEQKREKVVAARPDVAERFIFVSGVTPSDFVESFLKESGRPILNKPLATSDLRAVMEKKAIPEG